MYYDNNKCCTYPAGHFFKHFTNVAARLEPGLIFLAGHPVVLVLIYAITMMGICPLSHAQSRQAQIIERSVQAYGGEHLLTMPGLIVNERLSHYSQWLSGDARQGSMVTYLSELQNDYHIDFAGKRKVFKQANSRRVGSHGSDAPEVIHRLFISDQGTGVDHALQRYQPSSRITFDNTTLGFEAMLDTLLIRKLAQHKQASQWLGEAYIAGVPHDVITAPLDNNPDTKHTLYLNQQSGLLSRMMTEQQGHKRFYDFMAHRTTQAVRWSSEVLVSTAKGPQYHSKSRTVKVARPAERAFHIPAGYQQAPEIKPFDVSKLTVRTLADGVYFVGQDWGYTLFIDAGEYLVSAGTWQMNEQAGAWAKALAELRQSKALDKPVKYHIVTHHHIDHLRGLADTVAEHTTLLVHPADKSAVIDELGAQVKIESIPASYTLAGGKIRLLDVPNSHAAHNLVVYLPGSQILLTEDMFGSSFEDALHSPARWPDLDTYYRLDALVDRLTQQGITVAQYVSSHHGRVLTQADIDRAMAMPRTERAVLLKRLFGTQ
ncbi:MBL fold metallo-hydrolase [Pseudoalteromonas sp. R3]|uniref:MBL fold metallo-hydrolase n=1 Tax=Pseudoalteromonas sp. R3 TaxID=1709477 RepID=UPI0006B4FA66|nr:MBL fold metallo-hydrolase [Pseudoalteromonas sp. R3]AZZ99444.1 MBL fold metallo-hydrolase [Pseudoalteromonas sp. R3]